MTVKREHLSFDEQIIVAYAHYVRGVEQQVLTAIFCTNSGRVSEACTAIKSALDKVKPRPSDREEAVESIRLDVAKDRIRALAGLDREDGETRA